MPHNLCESKFLKNHSLSWIFFSKMSSNKEEINSQDAGKLKNFSTKSWTIFYPPVWELRKAFLISDWFINYKIYGIYTIYTIFQTIFTTPGELLKVRGQLDQRSSGQTGLRGSVLRDINNKKGIRGLYRGQTATLAREMTFRNVRNSSTFQWKKK